MEIIDKLMKDDIDFDLQFKPRLENSRFEMSSPVENLTIDEMAEVLGFICSKQQNSFYEPFPHINIETYYGVLTIFDADRGWLDREIAIKNFAIRCVFTEVLNVSKKDASEFNKVGCADTKLIKDSGRLIFQSSIPIDRTDRVDTILNKLLEILSMCERLYSVNAMNKIQAIP
jgi:hypothetical protein